ncbi:MAG: cytochrome c [Deltaproteobacteria bacterium]|nr:MAG: cytochrome c [Deltaproteobacteria bacterium]
MFYTGRQPDGNYSGDFPAQIAFDEQTMQRGHQRFEVYCTPCHGYSGRGDGMVARHADRLQEGTWVTPTSIHEARVQAQPVGELFNSITHGVRNMPAYGHLIGDADRWAIIMYVRALQRSQAADKSDIPAEILPTLQ